MTAATCEGCEWLESLWLAGGEGPDAPRTPWRRCLHDAWAEGSLVQGMQARRIDGPARPSWCPVAGGGNAVLEREEDVMARKRAAAKTAAEIPPARRTERRRVRIDQLEPNRRQPRDEFDAARIAELAASIRRHGLLQPPTVREAVAGLYEIVCGERRWRAAREAGLAEIDVEVGPFSDDEAEDLALEENLRREDLSAIEEARAFQGQIDRGRVKGPSELAKKLGMSQGHVSNRLRLLKLPASVQRRVISGEMPATHARELCRYAASPELVERLLKKTWDEAMIEKEGVPGVDQFREWLGFDVTAEGVSRPMAGARYEGSVGRSVPIFTPGEADRATLDLVELPDGETVALNLKLWDRRQKAWAKQWAAAGGKKKGKATVVDAATGKPVPPSEAERKGQQRERDARFRRRLFGLRVNWLRYRIAKAVLDTAQVTRLTLYLLCVRSLSRNDHDGRLAAAVKGAGGKVSSRSGRGLDVWATLDDPAVRDVESLAAEMVERAFWHEDRPQDAVNDEDVIRIAAWLRIDLAAAWDAEQMGPLSEAYWNAHDKEQLVKLCRELGVEPAAKKTDTVADLVDRKGLAMPKELAGKLKRPK